MPASSFYSNPFPGYSNGPVFHPGFQQSQADFAAWAGAYHNMFMASMSAGSQGGHMTPPARREGIEYVDQGRGAASERDSRSEYDARSAYQAQASHHRPSQPPQPYHPYKRGPGHRPSREKVGNMPRSTSQPVMSIYGHSASPAASMSTGGPARPAVDAHRRTSSMDSRPVPPATNSGFTPSLSRVDSSDQRERENQPPAEMPTPDRASPASSSTVRASSPLQPGPIASHATNQTTPVKPHPLSQAHASSPDPVEKKSAGLRSKLKGAFGGKTDAKKASTAPAVVTSPSVVVKPTPAQQQSPPPSSRTATSTVFTSPSEASTYIATPPTTPSQGSESPPVATRNGSAAPGFRVMQPAGLGSEVSLAATERTAQAPNEVMREKEKKRGLFRMKNMSTDNISLSSTVSSASLMIRKMGSIGKLAKRNSLAGISKIFKDRNRDEDDVLPEVEGKKKDKKLKKGKGEASTAAVSHATVESERPSLGEDDRAMAGLSPAAKLARQHTLRSKAEQEKKEQGAGIETPDATPIDALRTAQQLPSLGSISSGLADSLGPPEILHVQPRNNPSIVRAVAVTPDQEYDSDVDSSEGETIEDVTLRMDRTRLSDVPTVSSMGVSEAADAEFRDTWGQSDIDRNALPKKGILKKGVSLENLQAAQAAQARAMAQSSGSGQDRSGHNGRPAMPILVGGSGSSTPSVEEYDDGRQDPLSVHFSPFDAFSGQAPDLSLGPRAPDLYAHPSGNTSAPQLPSPHKPINLRSMTVPARRRINWAPECAVYSTYDAGTYDRRSEPSTCNRLTPELALQIKQELNAFKLEMPVHPASANNTHYFA